VRLGGEVDDRLASFAARSTAAVADVADDELDPGSLEIGGIARVVSLSRTTTSSPAAVGALAKWEPMKPAPPVTSTRIRGSLITLCASEAADVPQYEPKAVSYHPLALYVVTALSLAAIGYGLSNPLTRPKSCRRSWG